jgi:hypothetical protein
LRAQLPLPHFTPRLRCFFRTRHSKQGSHACNNTKIFTPTSRLLFCGSGEVQRSYQSDVGSERRRGNKQRLVHVTIAQVAREKNSKLRKHNISKQRKVERNTESEQNKQTQHKHLEKTNKTQATR